MQKKSAKVVLLGLGMYNIAKYIEKRISKLRGTSTEVFKYQTTRQ